MDSAQRHPLILSSYSQAPETAVEAWLGQEPGKERPEAKSSETVPVL